MDTILTLQTPNPSSSTATASTSAAANFLPSPPGITTTATSNNTIKPNPPLLVPKLEPLDDFFVSHFPHWAHHQPQRQQLQQQQQLEQVYHHRSPNSPPFPFPGAAADVSYRDPEEEADVYNDYIRVQELFRVAFGDDPAFQSQTPAQNDVVSGPNPQLSDAVAPVPNSQLENVIGDETDPDSRAIVPVPPPDENSGAMAVAKKKGKKKELVRVSGLDVRAQMHYREEVRWTRMVYDSIRVLTSMNEEKRQEEDKRLEEKRLEEERRAALAAAASAVASAAAAVASTAAAAVASTAAASVSSVTVTTAFAHTAASATSANVGSSSMASEAPAILAVPTTRLDGGNSGRILRRVRLRGDLKAAALMRERGLWLNRDKRIVGAIPGVYIGDVFLFRMELCVLGLHHQIQAGIDYLPAGMSPNGEPIATSVIVSGGYEDDKDDGEIIVYTGQGGQATNSVRQATHQKLESGNLALERSMQHDIEVRVIRGMRYEGSASKSGKVYVYDGLYKITDCWFDVGKSGFGVYKYRLARMEGQAKMGSTVLKEAMEVRKHGFNFKSMYCLSVDISNKKERVPVRLYNDIDDNQDPMYFEYLRVTSFPQFVYHQNGTATGCDCVDGCADGCFCSMKNGGEFPYNQQGMLVRGKPLVFECGPFCSCPPHCRNRVTQRGLNSRLEVFRSQQTGWGVRSLDLIQAGAFICEYTGVVLTREQAQILTMNGDSLIYPNRFTDRWAEWGDLSKIYSDYERPSSPSIPPLDFSLDVSSMRNVACYMSHSSYPNVLVQFVLYDHNNLMFPHLMLFAMENIPPMRELSIDYGVADEGTGKLSICNG